jgi:DNA invertase Pin-like site-specific DNA recombinase
VVDTVLVDQETIYAPRHGNDRLLLGLKGSLNEYELDLLRQRSLAARYEKARRGELVVAAPRIGVYNRSGFRARMSGIVEAIQALATSSTARP